MAGVLVAPVRTYQSIAARPTFWVPLLFTVLLGMAGAFLVTHRIDMGEVLRQQMQARLDKQGTKMSAQDLDRMVEMTRRFTPYIAMGTAVLTPGIYLLVACLYWGIFKFLGNDLEYPVSASVFAYGMMPWAVASVLGSLVLLPGGAAISGGEFLRRGGILASNLAALLPEGSGKPLQTLAASLDFFTLWTLLLLVIGYRTAIRGTTARAATVVVGVWAVYVAVKVGWATLFG